MQPMSPFPTAFGYSLRRTRTHSAGPRTQTPVQPRYTRGQTHRERGLRPRYSPVTRGAKRTGTADTDSGTAPLHAGPNAPGPGTLPRYTRGQTDRDRGHGPRYSPVTRGAKRTGTGDTAPLHRGANAPGPRTQHRYTRGCQR